MQELGILVCVTTVAALAMGCGPSSAESEHGLERGRLLAELSDEELGMLCESIRQREHQMSQRVETCTAFATSDSSSFEHCTRLSETCIVDGELDRVLRNRLEVGCDLQAQRESLEGCDASVQELDTCVEAILIDDAVRAGRGWRESWPGRSHDEWKDVGCAPAYGNNGAAHVDEQPQACAELISACGLDLNQLFEGKLNLNLFN